MLLNIFRKKHCTKYKNFFWILFCMPKIALEQFPPHHLDWLQIQLQLYYGFAILELCDYELFLCSFFLPLTLLFWCIVVFTFLGKTSEHFRSPIKKLIKNVWLCRSDYSVLICNIVCIYVFTFILHTLY